jgi:hypothetical protein
MISVAGMLGFAGTYLPRSMRRASAAGASAFAPAEPVRQALPTWETARNGTAVEFRSVSELAPEQLEEVAELLARAFDDTSLFQVSYPSPALRNWVLRALFATILKDAMRFGRVEIAHTHQIVGVVIWYPPGRYPMSVMRILRHMPEYLRITAASPLGVFKLFRAQLTLSAYRPKEPHCHGYFLCARPGNHVGVTLIKRVLKQVDELGMPIYLETQEGRTPNLYARFGFQMVRNGIETLPAGPLTWTMWRDPQPGHHRAHAQAAAAHGHQLSAFNS